ncbi:flavin reductase family protein [Aureitalea marina]|uniref:Flavin reductase like domain-containing protein n=1 Tax=Aureitalea marina TaxID=930804 RepID=A0A2S7KSW6_9FLAO|nr:flavin reductase [Aureitalea marina]PQB05707.1 hypothetical protein BST85_12960 [Aureitalea marina]
MPLYNEQDFLELEKYFRINLINTASGIRSPFLIGTCNEQGKTNLAIFNSVVHIGANPPCLGFIMRPHTVERHTYQNIKETGVFTLNLVHTGIIESAHHTSASYDREESEFDRCAFNPQYWDQFSAPFVQECRLKMAMALQEEHLIEFNKTILLIGRIIKLELPDGSVLEDGSIDHQALGTAGVSGLYSYYKNSAIKQLEFARPKHL